jgi:AmiR/NasT family two-component response regulator
MPLISPAPTDPNAIFSGPRVSATNDHPEVRRLRVLVANERQDRLKTVADLVAGMGHDVIAPQIEVTEVGAVTAREHPDVAFVGLGENSQHALELIEQIVHEAACPVVALLHSPDPPFVIEAARRGIFAYVTDGEPQEWQNSIEIVLRRFAEFRDLEVAFKRRTVTERAKGILMERHGVKEERAFQMLRDEARSTDTVLVEAAQSVIDGTVLTKTPS